MDFFTKIFIWEVSVPVRTIKEYFRPIQKVVYCPGTFVQWVETLKIPKDLLAVEP